MQLSTTPRRRLAARLAAAAVVLVGLAAPVYAAEGDGDGGPGDPSAGDATTTTSAAEATSTTLDDVSTTSTTSMPHGTTSTTGHGAGGEPGTGDGDSGTGDGGGHHGDPADSFPDDWTPEQVAYAEALIAGTEEALERYRNPGILPLLGFTWILDGTEPDGYQHWVNLGWFGDGHEIDPDFPESLVFRNGGDGPVLEAAMYMLPWGYDLSNIPEDIAWLPGWHVHDNLCFDANGRIVDIAENGVCERGFLVVTPPMIHVWIVDTPCGRFAGVDEHGLQCDHGEH
ncbi:MAG TPA: hypothetical protein VFZ77_11055 [Acidimicrobiales bacterium]